MDRISPHGLSSDRRFAVDLIDVDRATGVQMQLTLHRRVLKFMRKARRGTEPKVEEIERVMRG